MSENPRDLRRDIARWTYQALEWGRDHVPPGVRTIIGVLFMVGGVFGFLPILGFWMLPLGAAFIALDVPGARYRIDAWIVRLKTRAHGTVMPGGSRTPPAESD